MASDLEIVLLFLFAYSIKFLNFRWKIYTSISTYFFIKDLDESFKSL